MAQLYERTDLIQLNHHGHAWYMRRPSARDGVRLALILDEMKMLYALQPDISDHPTEAEIDAYRSWSIKIVRFTEDQVTPFLESLARYLESIDGRRVQVTADDIDESCTHAEVIMLWGDWLAKSRMSEQEKKESAPQSMPLTTPSGGTTASAV